MKKRFKMLSVVLVFALLLSSIRVSAAEETENVTEISEYAEALSGELVGIMAGIFTEEGETSENEISPFWLSGGHTGSVTSYGTEMATLMKTMSVVPDDETYTLAASCDSSTDPNYLGLSSGDVITLSSGATMAADSTITMRKFAILHGRGNYVASLRFLYTVAFNLMNKTYTGTKVQKLQAAINDSLGTGDIANNTFYGENKTYANPTIEWGEPNANTGYQYIVNIEATNTFTSLKQRLTLERIVYIVANTHFDGQGKAYTEALSLYSNVTENNPFETRVALKLIGIATHLCGDIYAHKTVVPTNVTFSDNTSVPTTRGNAVIYKGTTADFNGSGRWSAAHGIKKLVQEGSTITTQQITQWQKSSSGETGYPDSTSFYKERLNVATKQLVANMYNCFFDGTAIADSSFSINWFLHSNYTLRLANLKLYAYSIGIQPTDSTLLNRLAALDSAVAMSDVVPSSGYKLPGASNTTWKKGITASY